MNKPRTFVRSLTAEERQALETGRKSADAFTVRRSQILLASAGGMGPAELGRVVACTAQAVRDAIRAFEADGLACLTAKSHARRDPGRVWDRRRDADLKDLLHRPREFGKATSPWTPALVAEVCHSEGRTRRVLSAETIRQMLRRLGVGWKRAKHWITSPDPEYAKKKGRDRLIERVAREPDWVFGFQDVCWWTRLAQPDLDADRPAVVGGERPRPEGGRAGSGGVLRGPAAGHRRGDAAVLRRAAGERHHRGLPGLGVRAVGGRGEAGVRAGVGQRRLARQPAGAADEEGVPHPGRTGCRSRPRG